MDGAITYLPNAVIGEAPKYHCYIFNLGPMKHVVERGSLGTFVIPACEQGQPYSKPLVLPSIVRSSYLDAATYAMKTDDIEGKYIAKDLLNPYLGDDSKLSEGSNLLEQGCFWTFNETPTEDELAEARGRLEKFLRKLLDIATRLETEGNLNTITPYMRLAATYFGEDRTWNKIYRKIGECPVCGEPMKDGIAKHGCGYVPDPLNAYKIGVISLKERNDLLTRRGQAVPEEAK
jgi:hypothetical protein